MRFNRASAVSAGAFRSCAPFASKLRSLVLAGSLLVVAASAEPHVLVWSDGLDITTLNPLPPGPAANVHLNALTMAFLTTSGNGPLEPELAVRVPTKANGGIGADGDTVTFVLRPNLKWSDGAPLTSADIAFSVAVLNDPKTNAADRTGFASITSVETPSPTVAVLHLAHPYSQIVTELFSSNDEPLLPKHLLEGKDVNTADAMQLPVGAGPFRYTRFMRGDRVELEPNPYYHGARPKLTKIVYRMIPNQQTTANALRTGEIDYWPAAAKADADALSDAPAVRSDVVLGARPAVLVINTKSSVLADPVVRAALREGLDRASIVERSYRGGGELDESIVSRSAPGYLPLPRTAFDRARAIATLASAGWKAGPDGVRAKNGERLHVVLAGGAGSATIDQIFELIRADWTALGVEIETRRYVAGVFFNHDPAVGIMAGGKFDAAYFSYGQMKASALEDFFACKNIPPAGPNYSRTCDPELETLFAKYDAAYDPRAANDIARAIQRRLDVVVPSIVVTKRNEYYLRNASVTGLVIPPFAPFGAMLDVDVK